MTMGLLPARSGKLLLSVHGVRASGAAVTPARAGPWPRLLAHVDADGIELALEDAERQLRQRGRLAPVSPERLSAALKGWLATTGESVAAAVLVVDGEVAAGRLRTRPHARGVGIESLRVELGLRTLRVVDERVALERCLPAPALGEVDWILVPRAQPPRAGLSTVVCRLGTDGRAASLASLGPTPSALMSHPFAPLADDELAVVAALRARGVAPVFGQLLGMGGLSRAFEALVGIDYDSARPLAAEAVVSLAARDDSARRACLVVCAALAQLCALLSFDGVRRVLLVGRAATLLAPMLAQADIAGRIARVRAEAGAAATEVELGVHALPLRWPDGARAALDDATAGLIPSGEHTLADRIAECHARLTPANQRVAELARRDPAFIVRETITTVAAAAGVSAAQVSRFCRVLGFGGLVDLKLALMADRAREDAGRVF